MPKFHNRSAFVIGLLLLFATNASAHAQQPSPQTTRRPAPIRRCGAQPDHIRHHRSSCPVSLAWNQTAVNTGGFVESWHFRQKIPDRVNKRRMGCSAKQFTGTCMRLQWSSESKLPRDRASWARYEFCIKAVTLACAALFLSVATASRHSRSLANPPASAST